MKITELERFEIEATALILALGFLAGWLLS